MSPKPSQMERLVERNQKSSHQNRLLKRQLRRKEKVIKDLRQEIKDLRKSVAKACENALEEKLSSLNPKVFFNTNYSMVFSEGDDSFPDARIV